MSEASKPSPVQPGVRPGAESALLYVEGLSFCCLNLWYLAALIKERKTGGTRLDPQS